MSNEPDLNPRAGQVERTHEVVSVATRTTFGANQMKKLPSTSQGIALGGLAGNNSHGAGVLQAALECDRPPDMISCSSGQIHWVHRYLRHLRHDSVEQRRGLLREDLEEDIGGVSPTKIEPLDAALVSLTGKPSVFRPALA